MTKSTTLYANNARTTLSADITTSSVSFTVGSATGFPTITNAGDQFYVTLDDKVNIEVVLVTAVSSNTFTVTRAQDGTTAHAFAAATPTSVSHRLNAAAIRNFARIDDRLGPTTLSSLSKPSTMNGNSYLCSTNSPDGNAIAVMANVTSDIWSFPEYPIRAYAGTVGASATTTVIQLATATTLLPDQGTSNYMFELTSGTQQGSCRLITSMTSSSFTIGALSSAPSSSDTYVIYQRDGSNLYTFSVQQTTMFDPVVVTPTINFTNGAKRITSGNVQQYNGTTWSTYTLNYVPASTATTGGYIVPGANGGYAGINYSGSYHNQSMLLSTTAASSGVYRITDSAWDWRWDAGILAVGTVPYANVSGTPNLSVYAPLASPAFTGSPTSVTPPNGNNTTRVATTAFVANANTYTGNATAGTKTNNFSGIIEQWFTSFQAGAGGGIVTITYPVAFANTAGIPRIQVADANLGSLGASNFVVAQPVTWSLTGCTVNIGQNGGGTRDVTLAIEVRGT